MNDKFVPYALQNGSVIEVYFKDQEYYTSPLNENLELYISFETGEVVGVKILKLNKL